MEIGSVSASKSSGAQWWYVDLGGMAELTGIKIFKSDTSSGNSMTLEVSADEVTWTTIATTSGSWSSKAFNATGNTIRHVRVRASNTFIILQELQVFGTLVWTAPEAVNLALNKPSYQSSTEWSLPASGGNDGNFSSSAATKSSGTQWWYVDLTGPSALTKIKIRKSDSSSGNTMTVETSTDEVNWTVLASLTGTWESQAINASGTTARYIRLRVSNTFLIPTEVQVYGETPIASPAEVNIALNKSSYQSSTEWSLPASGGNDGNMSSSAATKSSGTQWWYVDLTGPSALTKIRIRKSDSSSGNTMTVETSTD